MADESSDDTDRVAHPFPDDEITHMTATKPRKCTPREYIASRVEPDGRLVAQCGCYGKHRSAASNRPQPILNFLPRESVQGGPSRDVFLAAHDTYTTAIVEGDLEAARAARARLEGVRSVWCLGCVLPFGTLTKRQGAVKANTDRLYSPEVMGTCMACNEQPATEYNHLPGKPKTFKIADYMRWKSAEAQSYEAEHSCNKLCACCHRLDEMSYPANRIEDPCDMPRGSQSGDKEELNQHKRRQHAKIQWPKYLILDRIKLRLETGPDSIKRVVPERVSTAREAHTTCFDFDHPDRDGTIGGEAFKKQERTWTVKNGKNKGKEMRERMSPSSWASLSTKEFSLSKIWESEMRPDVLRTWLTDADIHKRLRKVPRTDVTLEKLLAERVRVETAIQWVEKTYYDGKVTEAHDFHEDDQRSKPEVIAKIRASVRANTLRKRETELNDPRLDDLGRSKLMKKHAESDRHEERARQRREAVKEGRNLPSAAEAQAAGLKTRRENILRKRKAEIDDVTLDDAARALLLKKYASHDQKSERRRQKREAAKEAEGDAREVRSVLDDVIARVEAA